MRSRNPDRRVTSDNAMFDPFLRRKDAADFESLEEALEVMEHRESYRYLLILVVLMNLAIVVTLIWFDRTIIEFEEPESTTRPPRAEAT